MKTITELRDLILKLEKGNKQVDSAQMNEVLAIMSDLAYKNVPVADILYKNGEKRAQGNAKKS